MLLSNRGLMSSFNLSHSFYFISFLMTLERVHSCKVLLYWSGIFKWDAGYYPPGGVSSDGGCGCRL